VSAAQEGDEAVIRVRDTGTGIPPEVRKRLFEPFFTTKPVGKGTGLGLHVAYKIVRAHGGKIEVDSEVGKGTLMTVRLPLGRSAPEGAEAGRGHSERGKPIVLLVDDDLPSLRVLRRALSREPVRLLSTQDPRKALEWVKRRGIRLVLTDQRMPGMLGTELLDEVARLSPGTRRLLVTADPESAEVEGARGGVVESVIPKPWDEDVLRRAVRSRVARGVRAEGS
jgi:CheY-like chemotaxis protein